MRRHSQSFMRLRTRWIVVPAEKSRGVLEVGLEMIRIHLQTFYDHIHQLLGEILRHLVVLPVRVSAIAAWNENTSAACPHKQWNTWRRIVGLAAELDLVAQAECRDSQHGRSPNPDTLLSLELPLVSSQLDLWTSGTSSQQ